MQKLPLVLAGIPCAVLGFGTASAYAGAARTFISEQGNDGNVNCTLAAPCRTLQTAINTTNSGGEVVILNAAGYGISTITKAITINSIGVEGAITTSTGQTGITINAGAADSVRLSGLTLIGGGAGTNGIVIEGAASVVIQNTTMTGFVNDGIKMTAAGPISVTVDASTVQNNAVNGIEVAPSSGSASNIVGVSLNGVLATGNATGILIDGTGMTGGSSFLNVTLGSCNATGNHTGYQIQTGSDDATVEAMITGSKATNNTTGLLASGFDANTYLDRTQITGNLTGISIASSGTIDTYKNNQINGNSTDISGGTLVMTSQQ